MSTISGSFQYISQDLMQRKSYKTILAHEISHVTKRHSVKELQYRLVKTHSSITDVIKMVKNINSDDYTKTANVLNAVNIVKTTFDAYSNEQELEADACGLKKMISMDKKKKNNYVNEIIDNINYMTTSESLDEKAEHRPKDIRINNIRTLEKSL